MEQLDSDDIYRDDIHLVSRHSNWAKAGVEKMLQARVYSDVPAWQQFLRIFFMGVGVAFTTAGILFFFAYNWADLHKFAKIGIVEGLLVAVVGVVLFTKLHDTTKNILLAGASVMVGVLFAVYGQIYQTGANAYDFFLGWTIFVTLWVAVSGFAPLWLLWIVLINTTGVFYSQQVAREMPEMLLLLLFLLVNAAFLLLSAALPLLNARIKVPVWFSNVLALAVAYLATFGMILWVSGLGSNTPWDKNDAYPPVIAGIAAVLYAAGLWHGWKRKNAFFLAVVPFCILLVVAAGLLRLSDDMGMLLFISLFIIGGVTMIIRNLIHLSKKTTNA